MTALAVGSSVTVAVRDGGTVAIATNGGLASAIVTPTGGSATTCSLGPLSERRILGPYKEGASIVITNASCGSFDYDVETMFDPSSVAITGGTIGVEYLVGASESSVRAATALAIAAGGGTIVLPDATITLTSPLPLATGLRYRGVKPQLTITGAVADLGWTFSGGTVFVGDGTFAGMAGNNTPNGVAGSGSMFLTGMQVENIGFQNFTSGIDCGADNRQYGAGFSVFRGIYTRACTSYATNFTNFQQCIFSDFEDMQSKHGHRFASGVGNSEINKLYHLGQSSDRLGRGIWFDVPVGTDWLNQITINNLQCNQFGRTELSVAVTVSSGNPALSVPDLSLLAVGLPVKFTASVNGFTADVFYFIRSMSASSGAGTIQVAVDTYATTVVTPSGSTAMTLKSTGFPQLMLTGPGTGSAVSNIVIKGADLEGAGPSIVLDHSNGSRIELSSVSRDSFPAYPALIARTSTNCMIEGSSIDAHDIGNGCRVYTGPGTDVGTQIGTSSFIGHYRTNAGTMTLNLSDQSASSSVAGSMTEKFAGGRRFIYPDRIIGQRVQVLSSTSLNLGTVNGGDFGYESNTGTTWTLPAIVAGMEGLPYTIYNCGSGTLVVSTASSQLFNNQAAKTSYSLAAGQWLEARAAANLAANGFYWLTKTNGS